MVRFLLSVCLYLVLFASDGKQVIEVKQTAATITIDGRAIEQDWQKAKWYPINQLLLGEQPSTQDFTGAYKLLWDKQHLYLLARIVDDVLYDRHPDPLVNYWDDDCLEVFIDEDNSGGDHLNNFNAFAYHVALDNQVVDIAPAGEKQGKPALFNSHVNSRWRRSNEDDHAIYWELAITLFDQYLPADDINNIKHQVSNQVNKTLGFMLAYCDNDGSLTREHFIGSSAIKAVNGDKNLGYKTADVLDTLKLIQGQ